VRRQGLGQLARREATSLEVATLLWRLMVWIRPHTGIAPYVTGLPEAFWHRAKELQKDRTTQHRAELRTLGSSLVGHRAAGPDPQMLKVCGVDRALSSAPMAGLVLPCAAGGMVGPKMRPFLRPLRPRSPNTKKPPGQKARR
jgi:hypothetical protein